MTLLWVVGSPLRLFGGLFAMIGVLVTYLAVMEPYRLARLASFTDPFKDSQDSGWQAVQGLYALASGGWWGVGLGASREKWSYLPNAHTDFILAIIGEELGLVGTLLVVVLFGVLAYGGIRVAQRSADPFGRLAAAAITAWLVGQALINMGAVVGLLPITGIPLPLISFRWLVAAADDVRHRNPAVVGEDRAGCGSGARRPGRNAIRPPLAKGSARRFSLRGRRSGAGGRGKTQGKKGHKGSTRVAAKPEAGRRNPGRCLRSRQRREHGTTLGSCARAPASDVAGGSGCPGCGRSRRRLPNR